MTKRLIDIDDELLHAARESLGTSGISETVRAALEHANRARVRAEEIAWLVEGGASGLVDKQARDAVWR